MGAQSEKITHGGEERETLGLRPNENTRPGMHSNALLKLKEGKRLSQRLSGSALGKQTLRRILHK